MSTRFGAPIICLPSAQRPLIPTAAESFIEGTIWVETDTNLSYVLKYTGAVPSWIGLNGPSGGAVGPIYALDPSGATPGSFPTWATLYAAYSAGFGPAAIVVYGNAVVPAGTYPLRDFTRFAGPTGTAIRLTMANGAVFTGTNLSLSGLDVESLSSSPCFVLSLNVDTAVVSLTENSNLISSGTSPMIEWTVSAAQIARLLVNLVFESAFLNNGSAVIDIHGPGAGNPTVLIELGDGGVLGANTITSNADATVIVAALSPTASVAAQPGYLGAGTPFVNPSMAQTVNINSQGLSILNAVLGNTEYAGGTNVPKTDSSSGTLAPSPSTTFYRLTAQTAITLNMADPPNTRYEFLDTTGAAQSGSAHTITTSAGTHIRMPFGVASIVTGNLDVNFNMWTATFDGTDWYVQ